MKKQRKHMSKFVGFGGGPGGQKNPDPDFTVNNRESQEKYGITGSLLAAMMVGGVLVGDIANVAPTPGDANSIPTVGQRILETSRHTEISGAILD